MQAKLPEKRQKDILPPRDRLGSQPRIGRLEDSPHRARVHVECTLKLGSRQRVLLSIFLVSSRAAQGNNSQHGCWSAWITCEGYERKANVLSLYMPHHVLNVTNEMWGSERVNPSLRREQGIVAS